MHRRKIACKKLCINVPKSFSRWAPPHLLVGWGWDNLLIILLSLHLHLMSNVRLWLEPCLQVRHCLRHGALANNITSTSLMLHGHKRYCFQYCSFVCLSVNTITPEPLEISSRNFQGVILGWKGRTSSEMTIGVSGRWFNVFDVLLLKIAWNIPRIGQKRRICNACICIHVVYMTFRPNRKICRSYTLDRTGGVYVLVFGGMDAHVSIKTAKWFPRTYGRTGLSERVWRKWPWAVSAHVHVTVESIIAIGNARNNEAIKWRRLHKSLRLYRCNQPLAVSLHRLRRWDFAQRIWLFLDIDISINITNQNCKSRCCGLNVSDRYII